MRFKYSPTSLVALACAAVLPIVAPANAEIIRVTGSGSFDSVRFSRGATSTLTPGSGVKISFNFDTNNLTTLFSDANNIAYGIIISDFSASVGNHSFQLNPAAASLSFGRGFALLGGTGSEMALIQGFRFSGLGGSSVPFTLTNGVGSESISLTSFFRMNEVPTPSIDLLRNPTLAARSDIFYSVFNPTGSPVRQTGQASGPANIAFGAAVPEPTTWAMLIIGFGLIGGAMRRRTARAKAVPSAA